MNGYERLIKFMRAQEGQKAAQLKTGTITKGLGVKSGELELLRDDLLFSEQLLTGYMESEETFAPPVKKGDKVLLVRLSEEKYVVVAKLC